LVTYRDLLALHALDTSVTSMVGLALAPGVDVVIGARSEAHNGI
jgi:hypothetical protein